MKLGKVTIRKLEALEQGLEACIADLQDALVEVRDLLAPPPRPPENVPERKKGRKA